LKYTLKSLISFAKAKIVWDRLLSFHTALVRKKPFLYSSFCLIKYDKTFNKNITSS
jgi:hypothetical protein